MIFFFIRIINSYLNYVKPGDHYHIISGKVSCLHQREISLDILFPGTNRVIFLVNSIPLKYLSLNVDMMLVVLSELTIPVNENYGSHVTIIPATEESTGYYLVFGNKKLCGHGPNAGVFACVTELIYPRDAIWYIAKVANGYHIHRGNMCITKMNDFIGFTSKEEYSVQLRVCKTGMENQTWNFDHIDNFYM